MTKKKMFNSSSVTLLATSLDIRYVTLTVSTFLLTVSAGYLLKNNQSADIFFQATSAGHKEQEAINFLEKKMKDDPQFTYDETVQVICTKQYY
jgi:20S proteasome alpha/beta subunit